MKPNYRRGPTRRVSESRKKRGAALVEYSLLVALIGVLSIGAMRNLGKRLNCQLVSPAIDIVTANGASTEAKIIFTLCCADSGAYGVFYGTGNEGMLCLYH